jgi:hypothetical protein
MIERVVKATSPNSKSVLFRSLGGGGAKVTGKPFEKEISTATLKRLAEKFTTLSPKACAFCHSTGSECEQCEEGRLIIAKNIVASRKPSAYAVSYRTSPEKKILTSPYARTLLSNNARRGSSPRSHLTADVAVSRRGEDASPLFSPPRELAFDEGEGEREGEGDGEA